MTYTLETIRESEDGRRDTARDYRSWSEAYKAFTALERSPDVIAAAIWRLEGCTPQRIVWFGE